MSAISEQLYPAVVHSGNTDTRYLPRGAKNQHAAPRAAHTMPTRTMWKNDMAGLLRGVWGSSLGWTVGELDLGLDEEDAASEGREPSVVESRDEMAIGLSLRGRDVSDGNAGREQTHVMILDNGGLEQDVRCLGWLIRNGVCVQSKVLRVLLVLKLVANNRFSQSGSRI